VWGAGGMILTGDYRSTIGKTCSSSTLSTSNPTWTGLVSIPDLCDHQPATNRLNDGMAVRNFKGT
jgi:hypothetical protein